MRMRSNIRGIGAQKKLQLKRPRFCLRLQFDKGGQAHLEWRQPVSRFLAAAPNRSSKAMGQLAAHLSLKFFVGSEGQGNL